jgi:hypothetical protein
MVLTASTRRFSGWFSLIPLVLFNIGAALFLISNKSIWCALVVVVTAAGAMFVRPAGYFIPLAIVFFLSVGETECGGT